MKRLPDKKKFVAVGGAAKILGVSIDTVRRWEKQGTIQAVRVGNKRYFSISKLEQINSSKPFSISGASEYLNLSEWTLRRLDQKKILIASRNNLGERIYTKDTLDVFLNSGHISRQKETLTEEVDDSSELPESKFYFRNLFLLAPLIILFFVTVFVGDYDDSKTVENQKAVLASKDQTDKTNSDQSFFEKIIKPFSFLLQPAIDPINSPVYNIIYPKKVIYDVNSIFAFDKNGNLFSRFKLAFPKSSDLVISDKEVVTNLNADYLRGKKPGSGEGDLAVFAQNNTIDGLSITTGQITGTIQGIQLADGTITSSDLADSSVISSKITDGTIVTADLADGLITTVKIADSAVTSAKISDGTIATADFGDSSVTESKLKVVDSATDEECLTFESTDGDFEWQTCGGSGSGDITTVTAGDGLSGGGTSGDVSLAVGLTTSGTTGSTSSNSGLEVSSSGLTLLKGCSDGQLLEYTDAGGWACADDTSGGGGGSNTVEEGDSTVDATVTNFDFLAADFIVSESPEDEVNISIDYTNSKILRSDQNETITGSWAFTPGSTNALDINLDVDSLLTIDQAFSGTTTANSATLTLTNTSSSGTQNGLYIDNAASSGTTDSLLVLDNSDTDTAVTSAIQVVIGGGTGFTNLFDINGTLITSSEFTLLDSGIALSELTDSGTLTAGTVDINGGAIDGAAIGATSPSTGAFTTLSSTGVTTIGNNSATVAINSSDWDIDTTGAMTGIGAITSNGAISTTSTLNADGATTLAALTLDANSDLTLTSGTGSVVVTNSVSNASDQVIDINPAFAGGATDALTYTVIDVAAFSPTNAAGTDTINGLSIGALTQGADASRLTASAINIGDGWDTGITGATYTIDGTTALTIGAGGGTIALNSSDWDIDTTGAMTGIGAITSNGLITTTAGLTVTGAAVSLNASSNFDINLATGTSTGDITLGGGTSGQLISINSDDWDITTAGAITGVSLDVEGTGNSVSNIDFDNIKDAMALDADTSITFDAAEALTLTAAASTEIAGVLDINFDSATDGFEGINMDFQINDDAVAETLIGHYLNIDDNATTANDTVYGIYIDAEDAGASDADLVPTALLVLDNSDTDNAVAAGIQFVNAGGGFTAGIDTANSTIVNIGAAGTDFDTSGGLTLASTLVLSNNTITCTACVDVTDLGANSVDDSELADTISYTGALTIATSALAVNSDSITADGTTLTINAAGTVNIQDSLTVDSDLTVTGGDVTGTNAETIDIGETDNGSIIFAAAGETNNESIEFDFETTANAVSMFSSTGVTVVDWGSVGADYDSATVTLSTVAGAIDAGGATSLEVPNAAAPTVDAFGEIAGDNDYFAAGRGSLLFFDGTSTTFIPGVLSTDTCTNGQTVKWNTGGTWTCENDNNSGGATAWDAIADPATGTDIAMNELAQTLDWNTAATAAGFDGLTISITNDATSDGATQRALVVENRDSTGSTTTESLIVADNQDIDETVTNGLLIEQSAAGTMTNAIQIAGTAGTIANGILIADGAGAITDGIEFTGTFTNVINAPNFDVNNAGNITVAAAEGLDTNGAGALELGKANATSVDLCNSAACDTIDIGTNTDADTITIGDSTDNVAITDANWSITGAGALTVTSCSGCGGLQQVVFVEDATDTTWAVADTTALSTTAAITPTDANSEILVMVTVHISFNTAGETIDRAIARVDRETTTASCDDVNTVGQPFGALNSDASTPTDIVASYVFVDAPASASSQSYIICTSANSSIGATAETETHTEITLMDVNDSADLAEIYPTFDETLRPGEVVSLDPVMKNGVKRAEKAYQKDVLGVVSTNPAMVIGSRNGEGVTGLPIALSGRVPVKVTGEGGPIVKGDMLTSSSMPGVAMKATKSGPILGIAMTDFDPENSNQVGSVMLFVKTGYFNGANLAEIVANPIQTSADSSAAEDFGKTVLSYLVQDKLNTQGQAMDVSEIFTDRLAAGLEVITPRLIADEIIARSIKAERIEGIEVLVGNIAQLSSQFKSFEDFFSATNSAVAPPSTELAGSTLPNVLGAQTLSGLDVAGSARLDELTARQATISASLRVKGNSLIEGILSVVDTLTANNFIVNGISDFFGKATFRNDVEVRGRLILGKDSAGVATIVKGSDRVEVKFEKEYENKPVVNISIQFDEDQTNLEDAVFGGDLKYIVSKRSKSGFVIRLNKPAPEDINFSWTAIAGGSNVIPTGSPLEVGITPTITPTLEPQPTEIPTEIPTPTP